MVKLRLNSLLSLLALLATLGLSACTRSTEEGLSSEQKALIEQGMKSVLEREVQKQGFKSTQLTLAEPKVLTKDAAQVALKISLSYAVHYEDASGTHVSNEAELILEREGPEFTKWKLLERREKNFSIQFSPPQEVLAPKN